MRRLASFIFLFSACEFIVASFPLLHSVGSKNVEPKNIILDTDFLSFTDDVGALALLNTFQYCGRVRLLGIISEVRSRYAVPAMDAINTWYCHPDIPFGQDQPVTNITEEPGTNPVKDPVYVKALADSSRFPEDIHDGSNKTIQSPVDLYHSILSNSEDQSVTIIAIGFMSNLAALYNSPGGKELISKKVKELVVQGGNFGPRGPDGGPNGANYNLGNNLTAAKVLQTWPSPLTFLGVEVGGAVWTGKILKLTPPINPVRVAYEIYNNGIDVNNPSWDLVTAYFTVLGLEEGSLRYGNADRGGRIEIYPNGTAAWNYSAIVPFTRRQHFLSFRETNVTLAHKIDALLAKFGSYKPPCPPS